uniref:Ig-like domain-containing protein n=1 Tax=Anolis carolinensis TaxID=28377 RepID=H9GBH1_ANOCA|nr:PREDICTED: major histocompatibility complex class I-related gene protein [Anolis carolinensis]|eukprot:XP_008122411.1 PREDICTED: major histocompatibility complex class I-related gene protein [Anolis carolinensis]
MAVVQVDGVTIGHYDSQVRRAIPRVPWITRVEEAYPMFWDWVTDRAQKAEMWFGWDMKKLQKLHNQSGGIYTLQSMYGCEMDGDGDRIQGYGLYGYNGEDFLSFDIETRIWTVSDVRAETLKKRWDSNVDRSQKIKDYLERNCIEYLQKFLDYGKEVLTIKEPPTVKVSYDGLKTLTCRVDGFYPKEIDAVWKKDSEVWEQETLRGGVVPNSDGTFHTWLRLEVDPKDRDLYRCHVDHAALEEALDTAWEEPASIPIIIIIIIIAVLSVLVAHAVLLLWYKRNELPKIISKPFERQPLNTGGTKGQSQPDS